MSFFSSDIRIYLTSLEPALSQNISSQSIGGYSSNTLLYPETELSSDLSLYNNNVSLSVPVEGWQDWDGVEYIGINSEIMQVDDFDNGAISLLNRAINGIRQFHVSGDYVRRVDNNKLFNSVFNDRYKQYRCLAVKNTNSEVSISNISVDILISSFNLKESYRVGVEMPTSQYYNGVSSSFTSNKLIDESLIGIYDDNYFRDCYLRITDGDNLGQGRIVNTFDSSTGTFIFYNSFSVNLDSPTYSKEVSFAIEPSPAQRLTTGIDTPSVSLKSSSDNLPISLSDNDLDILNPNDIFYIWIERGLEKGASYSEAASSLVININYDAEVGS